MSNSPNPIVADASAIINLNATECAEDILRCLPERIVVVDIVCSELEEGRGKGRQDAEKLNTLVSSGLIEVVSLGDVGDTLFERLVAGPAISTVDDGEAATIAYAVENTFGVVIDDAKARRLCKENFPEIARRCSVELFREPAVLANLSHEKLSRAVLNALQKARMHVYPEYIDWVVGLIGVDVAHNCSSLPRKRSTTA